MDHAAFAELIAGRALGDLDVTEQRSADAHLRSCLGCRSLTRDLDGVMTELAYAVPPRPVPATLGPSILAAIHRDALRGSDIDDLARTAAMRGTVVRPARFAGLGRVMGVGLAAAAVIAIGVLGAQVLDLRSQLDDARQTARITADLLTQRTTAMQVVADPAHASAWLQPSHGAVPGSALMVYVPGSTDAWLVADGLPATPDGRVYQFWYADPAGVHAGVTFRYDGTGVATIPVRVDLRGAQAAMLTIEPDGGATAPSQDIVFGELPAS